MLPHFSGSTQQRRINLGGSSSQATSADLLSRVAAERERRLESKRRWEKALVIQSWWRGRRGASLVREEIMREMRLGKEEVMDVDELGGEEGGIRALRSVVVANWGGRSREGALILREWSDRVVKGGQGALYTPASNGNIQTWFVLMSRIAKTMLASLASSPESDDGVRFLTLLNSLLSPESAKFVLGQDGIQLCKRMTDHLVDNGLYTSLSQAVKHIPIESKSSPALPLILSLIALPLSTSASPSLTLSIFTHILTIPLLPNRLPLSALPTFTSKLPFTRLDTLNPQLLDAVNAMSTEAKIHFLANMSMFVTPAYKAMSTNAFTTYLELSTMVINVIPGGALVKRASEEKEREKGKGKGTGKKKRKLLGNAAGASASEDSRPQTPVPSSSASGSKTRVVVVSEFSNPNDGRMDVESLVLDAKTQARILKLASSAHLQGVFEARQGKDYGKVMKSLVAYLFALGVMSGGAASAASGGAVVGVTKKDAAKDKDKDRPAAGGVVQYLAGGGGGVGFVRELWRECVRGSPLGREGDGSGALFDAKNTPHWPALLLLADVYAQMMMTMGDDEFFGTEGGSGGFGGGAVGRTLGGSSLGLGGAKGGAGGLGASGARLAGTSASRTRNPLSLDELKMFSKKLLNVAFGLYWVDRSAYSTGKNVFGTGVSWEDARERLRVCLVGIRDRDSRRPFVPKDHWLVPEMSMAGFVEAAVMEEQNLINAQLENSGDPNAMDVDSSLSFPASSSSHLPQSSHNQHPAHQRLHRATRLATQKLSLLTPRLLILNNLPFAIPFEVRVKIFRHFIVYDAVRHNGGRVDMFGGALGIGGNGGGVAINPMQRMRQLMPPMPFSPPPMLGDGGGDDGAGNDAGDGGPVVGLGVGALGRVGRGRREKVMIRRDRVAQDGFDRLFDADLKRSVEIGFVDQFGEEEAGIDGGGVFKEFFTSLCKEVFDTDRGLWLANKKNELYPNPHAYATEPHSLNWYRFIGRILGKALYEGILVDVAFASFFISKLLDKQSFLDDLASLDPELYNGLIFLKHYEGDVEGLGLWFGVDVDEFGVTKTIDLIPNGANIPVTKENRLTYIVLMSHFRLSRQIKKQSEAFFEGLGEMIEGRWLKMFNQQEVQTLMGGVSGTPISVADLRQHTLYGGLYTSSHPTILAFWRVVESFNETEKKALLRFVTSCSRPPLLGFKELVPNFCIRDSGTDEGRLPTASTCVNLLKLPLYSTERALREKLLQAINSNAGFDLS
ncbi:hypothetical protein CVT24_010300 [Panaeolus cyanescens]|uniref:HECT-type E3 ubiquitin transferase n=1 Tax=Panaeolus cyanescens TaxID=181874 RepID=A0A409YQC5_9AGAR|nr:hypothetical protein CVT24_010300 [Panaeolus cyanescens]